jgi:hypothetical protein
MKKKLIAPGFYFFLLFTSICNSCKKSDPAPGANSFTWTVNGTTTKATWDSGYVHSMGTMPIIMAGKNGTTSLSAPQLIISISSFNTGSYSIGTGNEIQYTDDAMNVYFGTSGTVSVTGYSNNRLSGNFSVGLAGPFGSFPITGEFANVPVAP